MANDVDATFKRITRDIRIIQGMLILTFLIMLINFGLLLIIDSRVP